MKRYLLPCLLLVVIASFAQSRGNAEAEMEKAKKRIEADKSMDPAQKQMLLQMLNSKSMKDATQYANQHPAEMARMKAIDEGQAILPARDAKRLEIVPATPFGTVQVRQYAVSLLQKISRTMQADLRRHADSLLQVAGNTGDHASTMAVEEWLAGDPQGAAYIAAGAVDASPTPNALGNFGGMLNMLGYEEKAVPLLQYALKQAPRDPMLLNNLGRSWLGLGETAKAKQLFIACIRQQPLHPEANNSLACIYEAEKNPQQAIECYKHSLEGAFNENAYDRLEKLQPDIDLSTLIGHHFKAPRYFDEFKFQIPDECRDIMLSGEITKLHERFQWTISDLTRQYGEEQKAEEQKAKQEQKEMQQRLMQALQSGRSVAGPLPPMAKLAIAMVYRLQKNYAQDQQLARKDYDSNYHQLLADYKRAIAALRDKYQQQKSKLRFEGEGGVNEEGKLERLVKEECAAILALTNEYQDHAATLHQTFAQRYRPLLLDYFNARIFWTSFLSPSAAFNNANFYDCINDFLNEINYISESTPFLPAGELCDRAKTAGQAAKDKLAADKKPFCPISIKVGFLVGSLSVNCTSFSFSGGEGVKLGYKYNFSNQQSTLSIGAGLGVDIGVGTTAGANASESFYITFDGTGHPSDLGFAFDASVSGKIGSLTENISSGYKLGLNSGWNFSTPAFGASVKLN